MGVCEIFRSPVHGGSSELISKCLSSMILNNHSSYFKSREINSCRLTPLPSRKHFLRIKGTLKLKTGFSKIKLSETSNLVGWWYLIKLHIPR